MHLASTYEQNDALFSCVSAELCIVANNSLETKAVKMRVLPADRKADGDSFDSIQAA